MWVFTKLLLSHSHLFAPFQYVFSILVWFMGNIIPGGSDARVVGMVYTRWKRTAYVFEITKNTLKTILLAVLFHLKPRIHEHAKWFTNRSRTKCVYVWMGLWTCAAPSTNDSHTVHHEPKFVSFCANTKRTGCRWVSFPCTGCLLLALGSQKINRAPLMRRTRTAQCVSGALVYTKLKDSLLVKIGKCKK